jgi:hypothetical protein
MRFIWDWPLTIILKPIALTLIILIRTFNWIHFTVFYKLGPFFGLNLELKDRGYLENYANLMVDKMPVMQNDRHNLYCPRVPLNQHPNGRNHNADHQCARQGVWVALLSKLGRDEEAFKAIYSLRRCFHGILHRGYLVLRGNELAYETYKVSGDQMVGYLFGWHHVSDVPLDISVCAMGYDLLKSGGLTMDEGGVSPRANFKPGLQWSETPVPVGAQELTLFAGLLCANTAYQRTAKGEAFNDIPMDAYRKRFKIRFYLYFGWLTCLWPTAGVWFKRGYNNDQVCMQAAYLCYHHATNRFEKWIFKRTMINIFNQSPHYMNGYFAGLVREVSPKTITNGYLLKCNCYAQAWLSYPKEKGPKGKGALRNSSWPISQAFGNAGEFLPDQDQEYINYSDYKYHSGLGQLASFVWSLGELDVESSHEKSEIETPLL